MDNYFATMSGSNLSDAAALESTAAGSVASEDMPNAELAGTLDAIPVERGDNYVANDGAAKQSAARARSGEDN